MGMKMFSARVTAREAMAFDVYAPYLCIHTYPYMFIHVGVLGARAVTSGRYVPVACSCVRDICILNTCIRLRTIALQYMIMCAQRAVYYHCTCWSQQRYVYGLTRIWHQDKLLMPWIGAGEDMHVYM